MNEFRLPRLISDGMIIQQKKRCHIWGWNISGRRVIASFLGEDYETVTDEQGKWEIWLKESPPGGPYILQICDEAGNEEVVEDILIGDVWLCSGQSNMELPMERIKDEYPEEIRECTNSAIRTFKITEHVDYNGPLEDVLSGEWKAAETDTILQFSATAYFFAKELYRRTKVPVGLINVSLGGSSIESWMSREMLEGYDDLLALAEQYKDEKYVEERIKQNLCQSKEWHSNLDKEDIGLQDGWEKEESDTRLWKETQIPFFFRNTALAGFIGSVWFRRKFIVPQKMSGESAEVWLGTIVDSDTVYINGVKVGHTAYQYPPRKYKIPEGLLREGENTIVIRVKCEKGKGRFTPGKKYAIWNKAGEIDLTGTWLYREGAVCEAIAETDFINWKPTGLYNGMTAPCHNYTLGGVLWYQGESNTHMPEIYLDLMERMIRGYRKKWQDESLAFYYVQLPNYAIDIHDSDIDETGHGWPAIREFQRQALKVPGTGMAVAIDIGEDNDLHPVNKKDVGFRLAILAAAHLYGMDIEYSGPVVEKLVVTRCGQKKGSQLSIFCNHNKGGMYAYSKDKGNEITDFEVAGMDGVFYPAKAWIQNDIIVVVCEKIDIPTTIRYCYKNTANGGLVYNSCGIPMSPFIMQI